MGFFLMEFLKTTFKMRNLTQDGHNQGIFFQNQGTIFQFLLKGRGDLPPSPSSYAPVDEEAKQKHFVETLEVKVLYPKAEEATRGVL